MPRELSARRISLLVLVGVVAGNLLTTNEVLNVRNLAPLTLAAAAGLMARVSSVRGAAICVAATVAGAAAMLMHAADDSPLAALATEVPECVAQGTVLESRPGLGTFGDIERLVCGAREGPTGVVVFESDHAFSGSPFVLEGQLVPLGTSDFERSRRRAGAAAHMTGHAHFAEPRDVWRSTALSLREGLSEAASVLPLREGALLTGLTIGDTSQMSPADEEIFRDTGLSHLVAVSGSNIAIVVGSVLLLFRSARLWIRLGTAAAALALYVTAVGPDASVLRAAVMGGLALAALAVGRRHEVLSTLAYALAALLVLRPEMITSLGLQLSAAATAGLALWSGRLTSLFSGLPKAVGFALAATLAAQFAVAPLLIHHFERVSVVGPLSNLLALPAVAAATITGLGAGVLGTLYAPLGELGARVAFPFVWWIVRVADVTALPEWSSLMVPSVAAIPLALIIVLVATLALRRSSPDLVT